MRILGFMKLVRSAVALALFALGASACSAAEPEPSDPGATSEDELVGGRLETAWPAAGYLAHGTTRDAAEKAKVSCGATLVAPNVVVTAAHCVLTARDDVWVFGTGDLASKKPIQVVSRKIHPKFHEAPQSAVDVRYFLKNFDVATLVLAEPVTGVVPAVLPTEKTSIGCGYRALGYRAEASGTKRRSTRACVEFRLELGGDPIFEVHPMGLSALCHGDGDEGSPLVLDRNDGTAPVLHGVYVGSVTQGFTDCRRGTQFLNGYEAMVGFREFVEEGIEEGKKR